jgi:hypothetical protein
MNAAQLDAVFGTGFSKVKEVQFHYMLNSPATPIAAPNADVQEQDRVVDATFDAATGKLFITASAAGDGLWIPYLGNGSGGDEARGWGTYTRAISGQSWVATGKFSGCSIGKFSGAGGTRFAHLITSADGHPCATVDSSRPRSPQPPACIRLSPSSPRLSLVRQLHSCCTSTEGGASGSFKWGQERPRSQHLEQNRLQSSEPQ